jgi:hypothetical protein
MEKKHYARLHIVEIFFENIFFIFKDKFNLYKR